MSVTAEISTQTPTTETASHVLTDPPRFWNRAVFGPTAVFTALAIGSGELLFWPGLVLPYGAGVLLLALGVIALQWVVNIEIGRYSLATGESIPVGAVRLWRGWAVILLLGAVVPWLWPGWARSGAQLLSGVVGIAEKPLSIASLILCGFLLGVPARVYSLVERIQSVLLGFILLGVAVLLGIVLSRGPDIQSYATALATGEGVRSLLDNAAERRSAEFLALLGGVVFAGAGGILNLGYGLLLCEKGFGMGRYAKSIRGLRHSRGLSAEEARISLPEDAESLSRWRRWMSLSRREHALLFVGGNMFTMIFIALIFSALFAGKQPTQGMAFLVEATELFGTQFGTLVATLFVAVGFAIFFTSELGIIDVTSRIAAGIVHAAFPSRRLNASKIYHLFVWGEIGAGTLLILGDPRQPFWFLVTSAVLNTLVMAIYMVLVLVLNRRGLPTSARPALLTEAIVGITALLYASLFVLTLLRI